MSQLLLLIETSTPASSVALAEVSDGGERVLAQAHSDEPMRHTALLVPLVDEAFAKLSASEPGSVRTRADLTAVAVSSGPGSYTALRAGLSTAKGFCLGLGVPLLQVSTLAALAQRATLGDAVGGADLLAVVHARRREVYAGRYRVGATGLETIVPPASSTVDESWLAQQAGRGEYALCGPAAHLVAEAAGGMAVRVPMVLEHQVEVLLAADLAPLAAAAWRAGAREDIALATPTYLKPPFITKAKPRL